ncbi:unnamed protein product [Allacma fusca]|uniref:Uncharacterized protein n=1 Tax=Allacma fusca TaxID=39272 RepID=A0A8J2P608_9HEXA|nr:unnamed protein product [Allacma fusca]
MLTDRTYKLLAFHFRLASFVHAQPFKWEAQAGISSLKFPRMFIYYAGNIISTVLTLWQLNVILQGISSGRRNLSMLLLDVTFGLAHVSGCFFQLQLCQNTELMAGLLNHLFFFDKTFTIKYCSADRTGRNHLKVKVVDGKHVNRNGKQKHEGNSATAHFKRWFEMANAGKHILERTPQKSISDKCEVIVGMVFCPITYSFLVLGLFLLNPEDARYLYSFFPKTSKSTLTLYLWSFVEVMHILKYCLVFNTMLFIIMIYARSTIFWLFQLSGSDTKINIVVTKPPDKSEAIKNYKIFQVMNAHFNHCYSKIGLPAFKTLNIALHVLAIFVTITFYGRIPLAGYLIFPMGNFMWFFIEADMYPLLGQINYSSKNYLSSWKLQLGKETRRDFRSMFPLGVQVSIVNSIDRSTVLNLWSVILTLVINLILI